MKKKLHYNKLHSKILDRYLLTEKIIFFYKIKLFGNVILHNYLNDNFAIKKKCYFSVYLIII